MLDSKWDLRTPEARTNFVKAVAKSVKTKPIKCREVAAALGADMNQTRRALAALIEAGEISYTGTTRDVVYFRE